MAIFPYSLLRKGDFRFVFARYFSQSNSMASGSFPYRHIILTGASSGLGEAIALALVQEGAGEMVTISRRLPRHPGLRGIRHLAVDLADRLSLDRLLERESGLFSTCDLLINNAGAGVFCPFSDFPQEAISEQLQLLLHSPIRLVRAVLPGMTARRHGCLVNITSLAARFPLPYESLYNTAKAGLSGFTHSLQLELAGSGVRVLEIQPGDFRTAFNQHTRFSSGDRQLFPHTQAVWARLEANLQSAPPPELAARRLMRLLRRSADGLHTTGSFFQAVFAPLSSRLLSRRGLNWFLRRYFHLRPPTS